MIIDSGDKIIAYICPEQDISISAEFSKGKVRKYILSEGLKRWQLLAVLELRAPVIDCELQA